MSIDVRDYFHRVAWWQVPWLSMRDQYQALMRVRYPTTSNVPTLVDPLVTKVRARGGLLPSFTESDALMVADTRALRNENTARHFSGMRVFGQGRMMVQDNETTRMIALLLLSAKLERKYGGLLLGRMVVKYGWTEMAMRRGVYELDKDSHKHLLDCVRRYRGRGKIDNVLITDADSANSRRHKTSLAKRVYGNITPDELEDEDTASRIAPLLAAGTRDRVRALRVSLPRASSDDLQRDVPRGVLGEVGQTGKFADELAVVRLVFTCGFGFAEDADIIDELSRRETLTFDDGALGLDETRELYTRASKNVLHDRYKRVKTESAAQWARAIVNGFFGDDVIYKRRENVCHIKKDAMRYYIENGT